jgi:O-antigen/teichoic acid export membrane protein
MSTPAASVAWREDHQARTVALNVTARWVTIVVELGLGFLMLPFNTRHLGAADYGLWMLSASIVSYFPIMNLGYAASIDRFVAHYRARRDAAAINEIASTLFVLFAAVGLVAMVVVTLIAFNIASLFNMPPGQEAAGRSVLLMVGVQFAVGMPFAAFGGVVNGFQRTYLNGIVGAVVALAVAAVNIAVLLMGGTLVQLVAAMTVTRMLGFIAYRLNAYRVFPLLRIRPQSFSMARLREVTGFSVYMLMQNAANKANYATDPVVVAAFLSTGAVAVWTVAQRLADMVLRLTNQLNDVLFPVVVDCDSTQQHDRLRDVLIQGTRLSLALALPVSGVLVLLAPQVVVAWAGPVYAEAAVLLQLLVAVVLVRVGTNTAGTVLRGAGHHQLLSISNMVAALVNVVLSVILIRLQGLPGVAIATLVPVGVRGATILVPVACRRVRISAAYFVTRAIWPAAWPGLLTLGPLAFFRDSVPTSLLACAACGALIAIVYIALFAGLAVPSDDRARYVAKVRGILRPRRAAARPAVVGLTQATPDQGGGVSA